MRIKYAVKRWISETKFSLFVRTMSAKHDARVVFLNTRYTIKRYIFQAECYARSFTTQESQVAWLTKRRKGAK